MGKKRFSLTSVSSGASRRTRTDDLRITSAPPDESQE